MPELPEVETVVRGLRRQLLNQTLEHVEVRKPLVVKEPIPAFVKRLQGRTIQSIHRHGKSIFLSMDDASVCLKVHLGMTGQLLFQPKEACADPYVRVFFRLLDVPYDLVYRDVRQFGGLRFVAEARESTWGPDAWDSSVMMVAQALRKKSGMVKHALLNQQVIAGVGNIYADESLHVAKIHPQCRLETLSDQKIACLAEAVRAVLKESIDLGGTSFRNYTDTAGGRGGFKGRLRVYGKAGHPCGICHSRIKKNVVAGRGTHFCPSCQRGPRKKQE